MKREELEEQLNSAFGDGWYEGFLKAKYLSEKGEDLDDYDALSMSEDEEQIAKVGVRNKELLSRIDKLEASLLTVRAERDIYRCQSEALQEHLDELHR